MHPRRSCGKCGQISTFAPAGSKADAVPKNCGPVAHRPPRVEHKSISNSHLGDWLSERHFGPVTGLCWASGPVTRRCRFLVAARSLTWVILQKLECTLR